MKLSLIFALLFLPQLFWAQQLNFTNYSVSDGLAQSQVYAILPTQKGKLYLGTQGGGISIFDGKKFTSIRKEDGLISNKISTFYSQENRIIIGTDKGISIIENKEIVSTISTKEGVTCLFGYNNQIYVGTRVGLFKLINNALIASSNQQLSNKYITGYFTDEKNNLWISTQKGCWHISNTFKNLGIKNGWPSEFITAAVQNEEGIFLSTLTNGIIALEPSLKRKETPNLFSSLIINSLYLDQNQQLWIATQNNGVYIYAKNKIEHYTTEQGLANNHVKCVTEDHWGNTWIGTSGGGISKYNPTDFIHYNTFSGLNGDYIYTVYAEKDNIWVSTAAGGIVKLNDTLNKQYIKYGQRKIGKVRNLLADKNKNIWFTEEKVGLGFIHKEIDSIYYFSDSNSSKWILDMDIAKGGTIWLATADKGLLKANATLTDSLYRVSFFRYSHINKYLSNRIELVKIAPDNSIWIVDAKNGTAHFTGKELNFIKESKKFNIRTITFLGKQPIFGTENGLYSISKNKLIPVSFNSKLTSQNIYQLLVENDTTLWVGTEKGVDRVYYSENNEANIKNFGHNEGFRGVETSLESAFKDDQNNLWFGTIRGLERYTPSNKRKKSVAPIATSIGHFFIVSEYLSAESYGSMSYLLPAVLSIGR
ncbi:MAG: ligand-binding sensor domain-containing protein [Lishizhenia sp.]